MTPLVKTEDNKRLEFEVEQLEGEIKETEQLTASLQQEVDQLKIQNAQIAKELERINRLLQPVQTAAAQILPPEISILDMETGRFEERLQQLRRVEKSLNRRDKLNEQIQKIQNDITQLEVQVTEQHNQLNFEKASDDFADGMNSYLNTIRESNPISWTLGSPVAFHMGKSGFKATIAREKWSAKLGGTLTLYFIIAYHYALMSLVSKPGYHYPGLLILDFPPELEDGSSVADKENFVLEPFLKLQESLKPTKTQVIAMGSSFKDLPAASRIEFKKVWGE
jgi:small-conductance mechanosensitive channel